MRYISIVIPNYNGVRTIGKTIHSLKNQTLHDFDVTIIDDKSRDNSVSLILEMIRGKKNFKLVELSKNKGASNARNVGVKKSSGKIILFTDSDVILKKDTIERVVKFFKKNNDVAAVVGLPDKKSSFNNLTSEHFNFRVHYNYVNLPKYINILYTSICAVRRDAFKQVNGFNTKIRDVEDPELGFRLSDAGYKIVSDKKLSIFHYKYITFFGLLKNDYKRSMSRIKLMFQRKMTNSVVKQKKFISTPINQIYSALIAPFIWLSILIGIFFQWSFIATGILLLLFLKLNVGYLNFVSKEKGFLITIQFYFLLLIDMSIVALGVFSGLLKYVGGERN